MKFQEPYLLINVYHKVTYIRDLYSWEEIKLIYSDSLEDIECQLLFTLLKFLIFGILHFQIMVL